MEKGLYWFLRVFSIIVASGMTILIGLGLFCSITGLLPIAMICFAAGGGCFAGVKAMMKGCETLKTKF